METETKPGEVICRNCKLKFTPSIMFDFYPDGSDPSVGLCENCMMAQTLGVSPPGNDPKPLPDGYREKVCKLGSGPGTCGFLGMAGDGLRCLKGSTMDQAIRARIAEGSMDAQGDNCSGPPDFKVNE